MTSETIIEEKGILIRINRLYSDSLTQQELYEATRGVWIIGSRREEINYAFCVYQGIIKEVYKIRIWVPAGTLEYKTRSKKDVCIKGRWEFDGDVAAAEIRQKYIGSSVRAYFPKGSANPIIYT